MSAILSLVIWVAGSLRLVAAPVTGILLVLCIYPMLPRYIAFGFGESGFAVSAKRMLLATTALYFIYRMIANRFRINLVGKDLLGWVIFGLFAYFFISLMAAIASSGALVSYLLFIEDLVFLFVAICIAKMLVQNERGTFYLYRYGFFIPLVITIFIVFVEVLRGAPILSGLLSIDSSIALAWKGEFYEVKVRNNRYRAKGLAEGQLVLAEFTVYCLIATIFAYRERFIKKIPFICLLVGAVGIILATGSRAALLLLAVIFLITVFFTSLRSARRLARTVVPFMCVIAFCIIGYAIFQLAAGLQLEENFYSITDKNERSTYGRLLQYRIVYDLVLQSPVWGYGYHRNYADEFEALHTIDNFYLVSAIKSGILGLVLFFSCVLAVIISSVRSLFSRVEYFNFFLWITTFAICFSIFKLFLTHPSNNFYFILLTAYSFLYLRANKYYRN